MALWNPLIFEVKESFSKTSVTLKSKKLRVFSPNFERKLDVWVEVVEVCVETPKMFLRTLPVHEYVVNLSDPREEI